MSEDQAATEERTPEEVAEAEHFSIVGVQMGMRRHVVRNLSSTTVNIGDRIIEGFRCQMVDPAVKEEDPPELLDVVIPTSSIQMFIIQPEPTKMSQVVEDATGNGAVSEEERIEEEVADPE